MQCDESLEPLLGFGTRQRVSVDLPVFGGHPVCEPVNPKWPLAFRELTSAALQFQLTELAKSTHSPMDEGKFQIEAAAGDANSPWTAGSVLPILTAAASPAVPHQASAVNVVNCVSLDFHSIT